MTTATAQHQIIKETTDAIVQLLKDVYKDHGYKRIHVIVEAPKPDNIEGKLPACCVYLYQIGPDWEGVGLGSEYSNIKKVRLPDGKIVEVREEPPTWVRLDYLVSTWAQTPEDEQLLLGLAIKSLNDTHYLEGKEQLKGESFAPGFQLPIAIASRLDEGTLARFWGSLNQPIRPALNMYTVVPIFSAIETPFRRVEERVIGYERLGIRGATEKEFGPPGTLDMPPRGVFVKRKK